MYVFVLYIFQKFQLKYNTESVQSKTKHSTLNELLQIKHLYKYHCLQEIEHFHVRNSPNAPSLSLPLLFFPGFLIVAIFSAIN